MADRRTPRRPAVRPRAGTLAAAVAWAAIATLAGCGGRAEEVALATRIDVIESEIKTRIGPATCSVDSDCRALPIGARACGGPDRHLPYSIRGTDEGALGRLAEDHRRLSAELLAQQPAGGACVVLAEPVAVCERSAPLACRLR